MPIRKSLSRRTFLSGLGAAAGYSESRDDLVEDEKCPIELREPPEAFQEALGRRHHAHVSGHGLDYDCRHVLCEFREKARN